MSIIAAKANKTRHRPIASVDDHDMKKTYCEQPAINVIKLFKAVDRPAFFPSSLIAMTNSMATKISKTSTAINSLPPESFKKGIIVSEKPGGKNKCVS